MRAKVRSDDAVVSLYFDFPLGDGMLIVSSAVPSETQIVEFNSTQTQVDVTLLGNSDFVRIDIYLMSGKHYYALLYTNSN